MKDIKSKEAIRKKHLTKVGLAVNKGPIGEKIQKPAFDAMDEYAKQEAIGFAKWLQDNRWYYFDLTEQKWHYTFEQGTAMSKVSYSKNYKKTSEELYELYLQSKQK